MLGRFRDSRRAADAGLEEARAGVHRLDVGAGVSVRRASSSTEPTSASSSVARPASMSCSMEVLCAPTRAAALDAPLERHAEADAELAGDGLRLAHHRGGKRARHRLAADANRASRE